MAYKTQVGDHVPPFSASDHTGRPFTDRELLGKLTILYFYPKDDTPGCTKEACQFRDAFPYFEGMNAQIVGVSPDKPQAHQKFREKFGLPFLLLSDEEKTMCHAFDVWQKKQFMGRMTMGVERTTFLISPQGEILWVERPVTVSGHSERVKQALQHAKL